MLLTNSKSIRDVILFLPSRPRPCWRWTVSELFIGGRYLRAKRKQAVISIITATSTPVSRRAMVLGYRIGD